MAPLPISPRAALRQEIGATLRTDSDLEAFCGDYFPHVAAHFTNGQDRVAKVNLLLELAEEEALRTALAQYRLTSKAAAPVRKRDARFVMPSRATLLAKSENLLLANESAFEQGVDVVLGIKQQPQLVKAQQVPHGGAHGPGEARPLEEPLLDYLLRMERLLLLGIPGAGKTQTLRILCGQLLSAAKNDPTLPVPFLINFSTFSNYRGPVRDWLAEGLKESAAIPLVIGQALLQQGQLFLLLDGLDEVAAERRAVALTELNALLSAADPSLARCVVCSRTLEYTEAGVPLLLPAAVELQPLSPAQVVEAVAQAGPPAAALQAAMAQDQTLATMLQTPLLLTVAVRSFAGTPGLALAGHSAAALRQLLYDAYVVQMLRRTAAHPTQGTTFTLRWLRWLAQHLTKEQSSLFLIERLQPAALAKERTYRIAVRLVHGLVVGLGMGLLMGHSSLAKGLSVGLGVTLWATLGYDGCLVSLVLGLICLIIALLQHKKWSPFEVLGCTMGSMILQDSIGLPVRVRLERIEPVERLHWSWEQARGRWKSHLMIPLTSVLVGELFGVLHQFMQHRMWESWQSTLVIGLMVGLCIGLPFGLFVELALLIMKGWLKGLRAQSAQPNEGIRSSVRHGLQVGGVAGLYVGLMLGLVVGLLPPRLAQGLIFGLGSSLVTGLVVGLGGGLGEALKHFVLRIFLWRNGSLPLRLVPWLEACRARLLLRRQGGAYLFWHVTLQEYFGALDDMRLAALVQRIESRPVYSQSY